MVNALSLFKSVTGNSAITITTFNEQITKQLLIKPHIPQPIAPGLRHSIITTKTKRMCKICYARISENSGKIEAQNKTKYSLNVMGASCKCVKTVL